MRIWSLIVAALLLASTALAEEGQVRTLADQEECRELCDGAMAALAQGGAGDAFNRLEPYWVFAKTDFVNFRIETTKQLITLPPRFGKVIGSEFVRTEAAGDSVLRLTYIQKYERHPVRWVFTFYRPSDRWLLNGFKWDENVQLLFK